MTRGTSPTFKAITIDYMDNTLCLDHATVFRNLKDLLNDGIKPAIEAQFTALQKIVH